MTPAVNTPPQLRRSWAPAAWFGLLLTICYAPVLRYLAWQWNNDPDMGHGFFVPVIAAYMVWQKRAELAAMPIRPSGWGVLIVAYAAVQLFIATLGAELFLARTAFVLSVIGVTITVGGRELARKLAFPLFLLFFMVPIPAVIYNRITFPLQLLASQLADQALTFLGVPVLREGNVLELAQQKLSVVEACSGIRSLLSLTFLSLVYGYFFEKKAWVRTLLFLATIPIAIAANSSRVTLTGLLAQYKPEFAEGFFHLASGWVIFMVALAILVAFHQILIRGAVYAMSRRSHAIS